MKLGAFCGFQFTSSSCGAKKANLSNIDAYLLLLCFKKEFEKGEIAKASLTELNSERLKVSHVNQGEN